MGLLAGRTLLRTTSGFSHKRSYSHLLNGCLIDFLPTNPFIFRFYSQYRKNPTPISSNKQINTRKGVPKTLNNLSSQSTSLTSSSLSSSPLTTSESSSTTTSTSDPIAYHNQQFYLFLQSKQYPLAEKQLNILENLVPKESLGNYYGLLFTSMTRTVSHLDESKRILKEMKLKGIALNRNYYNTLITLYCRKSNITLASELFNEMITEGISPDVESYTPLIQQSLFHNNLLLALNMITNMINQYNLQPSILIYQTLLDYYIKTKRPYDMMNVMIEMLQKQSLTPIKKYYIQLFNLFYNINKPKKIEYFLLNILWNSPLDIPQEIIRDLRTYHSLMIAYGKISRPYDAERILLSLLPSSSSSSPSSFSSSSSSNPQTSRISSLGIQPTIQSFTIVMNAYQSIQHYNSVERIFNLLLANTNTGTNTSTGPGTTSSNLQPDLICYTTLMNSYTACNRYDDTIRIYHQLLQLNIQPDTTCYNIYLRAIQSKQYSNHTTTPTYTSTTPTTTPSPLLIEQHAVTATSVESNELPPSNVTSTSTTPTSSGTPILSPSPGTDTYNTLIHNSILAFNPHQGEHLLREMYQLNITPCVITYTTLLSGYAKVGLYSDVQRIFHEMLINNIQPNEITFHILITITCRLGNITQALYYLDIMKKQYSLQPLLQSYHEILEYYTRTNQLELIEKLFLFLKKNFLLNLTIRTYKYLLRIYEKNNLKQKYKELNKEINEGIRLGKIKLDTW